MLPSVLRITILATTGTVQNSEKQDDEWFRLMKYSNIKLNLSLGLDKGENL